MKWNLLVAIFVAISLLGQSSAPVKKFSIYATGFGFERWPTFSDAQKAAYMAGFLGGLGSASEYENKDDTDPRVLTFLDCVTKLSGAQLVAIVDKYYTANPKFWNAPMNGIVGEVIKSSDSPCRLP